MTSNETLDDGLPADAVRFAGCMSCSPMLDGLGEPRKRFVRVTLDCRHCVMYPSEGDTYIKDAKDAGDDGEYTVSDVYMIER